MSTGASGGLSARDLARGAALALAYFVTAKIGLSVGQFESYVTLVWPPSGVALAALLFWGLRFAPAVFGAAVAVNASLGEPLAASIAIGLGNSLAALAGAWLCGRVLAFDFRLPTVRDVFVLVFAGALAPSVIAATIGAVTMYESGTIAGDRLLPVWLGWWAGDAQGVLFVAPLALTWFAHRRLDGMLAKAAALGAGIGAAVLALGVMLSGHVDPGAAQFVLALAMFPLLLWPAVNYGMREVAMLNAMVAAIWVGGTAAGAGPFALPGVGSVLVLHASLALIGVTTLVLAARSNEGRTTARRLAESEARFRSLTALSADWYWEQDADLRFTAFSSGFKPGAGLDEAAFLGKRLWEIAPGEPHEASWAEHRRALDAREPFRDLLVSRTGPDGEVRYHLTSGEPVYDDAGRFTGYRGIGRDVTAQKRAELALAASRELFERLFEAGPIPTMFRRLEDGVVTAVNNAWCRFYGRARDDVVGSPVQRLGLNPDAGMSAVIQEHVTRGRSVRDFELRVNAADGAVRDVLFCASVVPIGGEDVVISTSVDVTDRNRAQAEVGAARARFERLFRSSPQPIAISELDSGAVIDVSDMWLSTYGYSRDEVLGRSFVELGVWVDVEERRRLRDRLQAEGTVKGYECRWRRKSGDVADVLFHADMVILDGHSVMLSTGMDITDRKRQERLLAESERRFVTIFQASPLPVVISREDNGEYVEVNEAWTRFFGYSREETLGRNSLDLGIWVTPADRERFVRAVEHDDAFNGFEVRLRKRSGELCDVMLSSGVIELGGRRCLLASVMDISERKRAEAALQESERRFRDFAEAAGEYVWELDAEGRYTFLSRRVEAVLGYSPEELYGRTPFDFMPPGEDTRLRAWFENLAETKASFRNVEHRALSRSGSQVWQSMSGVPLADAEGRLTGWRGTALEVTERKRAESRIADLATRDPLTGLPNRLLLADRLNRAIVGAQREGTPLAVMFIDLDHFKSINDTLGHEVGDLMLKEVASRIGSVLRKGDTLSRLGGDEFVVVLERLKNAEDAGQVAQKVITGLAQDMELAGNVVRTGASIGVAIYPADGVDASALMRHADTAMYVAKSNGRGNYQFYSTEMTTRASERMQLETNLKRALDGGELRVLYQPRVEVGSGQLTGVEALLRWQHPERGLLTASQFMRLVNESGLAHAIGEWVLHTACSQGAALHAVYGAAFALSVNVSTRQFNPGLVARVKGALDSSGLDPQLLELDLMESALTRDAAQSKAIIARLRALGLRIVVDDFGTGYSSLGDLRRYGIDGIKIDRSLVRGILTNPDDRIVVKATIDMARSLRINTIAEGVEDAETLAVLKEMGCEEYLGYFRAEPMPAGELERRFLRPPNVVTFPQRG